MLDMIDIRRARKNYKEYGRGPEKIDRNTWIKNWKMELIWSRYFDVEMDYVEKALRDYCESNDIEYYMDCDRFYCISNRKQYNDIMRIVDEILYDQEDDEEWD